LPDAERGSVGFVRTKLFNHFRRVLRRRFSLPLLALFQLFIVLLLSGHLFGPFFPTVTVSCHVPTSLKKRFPDDKALKEQSGSKKPELRRSEDVGVPAGISFGVDLEFDDVLGLGAFGTLDHLEFHFLVFGQGAEAFADYGAVMYEDIGAVLTGDEAITLGIVKPFYSAGLLHCTTSYRYPS
jgi:hypothetical protein